MTGTFNCPSCGVPCHVEFLDYDGFGAGCPHCGEHISNGEINTLTNPKTKEKTNA